MLLFELRTVLRSLRRAWGYAIAVIGTLALGIGSTTAIYTVVAGTLFRPTGYRHPEQLVRVEATSKQSTYPMPTFLVRLLAYRERATSFSALVACSTETLNLVFQGEPEGVSAGRVSADFFTVLGVTAALGRTFVPGEDQPGNDQTAVLSHYLWVNRFGRDKAVLGQKVLLDGRTYEIVGVLPPDYTAPASGYAGIYVPFVLPKTVPAGQLFNMATTIGRLKPGVTPAQAQAEIRTLRPEAGQPYERTMSEYPPVVVPIDAAIVYPQLTRMRSMLWTSLGAVAFLYAIACVNAGNLMVVRTLGRRRELCVCLALGGSRWNVIRPLLLEGLLLAVAAIVLGVLVAKWGFPVLMALAPGSEAATWNRSLTLSWRALLLLAALGLVTGVAIAAGSAWRASAFNLSDALKQGGPGAGNSRALQAMRSTLVIMETALAVTLLTGAGLMVRTFEKLRNVDLGYEPAHKLAMYFRAPRDEKMTEKARIERYQRVIERLQQLPGVIGVGLATGVTPGSYFGRKLKVEGEADEIEADGSAVSPEFFNALGVRLRTGCGFEQRRPTDPPAVLINETMARRYFAGQLPAGRRLEVSSREKWEVIGVIGDVRSPREEAQPRYYYPHWQRTLSSLSILLRLNGEPGPKFGSEVRRAIYEIDQRFAVTFITSLTKRIRNEISFEIFLLTVLEVLSALALLLAALGMFAMLAYTVNQRRSEFGIRLALGATPENIKRLVLGRGIGMAAAGVAIGLGLTAILARFLESMVYQVSTRDPLTYAAVGLLMLVVAIPACWWPARRATQVDLTRLLRTE